MEDKKIKLFFSMLSGNIYEIEEDETKNLDNFQVPLIKKPHHSCKKCYGRLYTGQNDTKQFYIICRSCGRKCIDFKYAKKMEQAKTPEVPQSDKTIDMSKRANDKSSCTVS